MKRRGCSSFNAGEEGEGGKEVGRLSPLSHISPHKSPCPPHCQLCYSTFLGNFLHSRGGSEVLGHIHQPISWRAGEPRQTHKLVKYVRESKMKIGRFRKS